MRHCRHVFADPLQVCRVGVDAVVVERERADEDPWVVLDAFVLDEARLLELNAPREHFAQYRNEGVDRFDRCDQLLERWGRHFPSFLDGEPVRLKCATACL